MQWTGLFIGLAAGLLIAAVTARELAVRALRRAREAERRARSAERMAELGAMTSGLAHEIKNPLSTIGLNAQLIAEAVEELPTDAPAPVDARQRLSRRVISLRREVERLRGILGDFLAYAGEMRLDHRPLDLNQLVDELSDFFQPQAEQSRVRLRCDLAAGPLMVSVDSGLLKQAALNLMLNAVQALGEPPSSGTPHAGVTRELILRTRRVTEREGGGRVLLHVIDTGPGIPPEVQAKLFTPYFTTKAGGSGLGLATTRRIIEAHQGRIEIHSEPGRGTDFTISLPAADGAAQGLGPSGPS